MQEMNRSFPHQQKGLLWPKLQITLSQGEEGNASQHISVAYRAAQLQVSQNNHSNQCPSLQVFLYQQKKLGSLNKSHFVLNKMSCKIQRHCYHGETMTSEYIMRRQQTSESRVVWLRFCCETVLSFMQKVLCQMSFISTSVKTNYTPLMVTIFYDSTDIFQ